MIRRAILVAMVLATTAGVVFAATGGDVLVVYEGRTETNRHAISFVEDYFRANDVDYRIRVKSVVDAGSVKPESYRAVVVLNTGRPGGISPALATIVERWSPSLPVVTVNLRSRRETTAVEHNGVDSVTAATRWQNRGLFRRTNEVYEMHEEWAGFILSAINRQVQDG